MSEIVKTTDMTPAERFARSVEKHYAGEVGHIDMTDSDRTLMQHIFIKCDTAMAEMNAHGTAVNWQNVNIRKLAIDSVNRVKLGIDGIVPGHLYPIAYYNKTTGQYDIDLRIGYKGEMYYIMKASLRPIREIRVELVHSTDVFKVYKKGLSNKVEGYDFEVTQPFDRGEVVGGFAYIEYVDELENTLVVMSKAEFDKRKAMAQSDKFWSKFYEEMCYKTLVHKAIKLITIDPNKVNLEAMNAVENEPVEQSAPTAANGAELIIEDKAAFKAPEVTVQEVTVKQEEPDF